MFEQRKLKVAQNKSPVVLSGEEFQPVLILFLDLMLDFFQISIIRASDWTANEKQKIVNPILTVPIKLPSSEKPTPEMKRAKVIPYFVLTQKYKTFPAIPKIIPTTAGNLPFLFIVQTQMKKVYGLQ